MYDVTQIAIGTIYPIQFFRIKIYTRNIRYFQFCKICNVIRGFYVPYLEFFDFVLINSGYLFLMTISKFFSFLNFLFTESIFITSPSPKKFAKYKYVSFVNFIFFKLIFKKYGFLKRCSPRILTDGRRRVGRIAAA